MVKDKTNLILLLCLVKRRDIRGTHISDHMMVIPFQENPFWKIFGRGA